MYNYELKIITGVLTHAEILFPKKCHLIYYVILFGYHNINDF
jgi:hypothetical protein